MSIIRQVQLEPRNEPIVPLAEKVLINGHTMANDDYGIDVDPPYQREPVWDADRRRNLIRSILIGLPIGALTFNERAFPHWRVCIDGKQRLLAVRAFISGELRVPTEWWTPDCFDSFTSTDAGEFVSWGNLTQRGRRIFDAQATTVTHTARLRGDGIVEKETELFNLINYGGVPQGESDHR
jgi:hypothetical protein